MKKIGFNILLFSLIVFGFSMLAPKAFADERPFYDKYASGYSNSNSAFSSYTQGYRFRATQNGQITKLWCYGYGDKVSLWEDGNTTPLASATISCSALWKSADITPVNITAGTYYRVGVYTPTFTTYYRLDAIPLPYTQGNIYVSHALYGSGDTYPTTSQADMTGLADVTFSPGIPPTVSTVIESGVTTSQAILRSSVNPNGISTTVYYRYGTSNVACASLPTQVTYGNIGSGTSTVSYNNKTITGLSSNTTYYYCAYATNSKGTTYGSVRSFTTVSSVPSVTTSAATSISTDQATLNSSVNPNGAATTVYYRYGTTSVASCGLLPDVLTYGSIGSGTSAVSPNAKAFTGLTPGTTYYFCATATNSGGSSTGSILSFTTNSLTPIVTTTAATELTTTEATMNASVNPSGISTTVSFRYGTSNVSCASLPNSSFYGSIGSGTTEQSVGQRLSGFTPGTTYYFCATATNSQGTTYGNVLSFTTQSATPIVTTSAATSVNSYYATLNGSANPNGYSSYGFFRVYTSNPSSCSDNGGARYPSAQASDSALGALSSSQLYSYDLFSLTPGTTYYVCAFARNQYGTVGGAVQSFTTPDGPVGPCDPATTGDHRIISSCSYSGTVTGVDEGAGTQNTSTLTVASGKTLTVNPGQTVGWGVSATPETGGAIAIASGATFRSYPIWVIDADGDGYPANGEQYAQNTAPQGGVRRNTIATNYSYVSKFRNAQAYDCDDNSYSAINSCAPDPVLVGTYDAIDASTRGIVVSGNYAYLGVNHGMEIANVSNPAAPTLASDFNPAEPAKSISPYQAFSIGFSGNYAYLGGSGGSISSVTEGWFMVIDVSDPSSPQKVGEYRPPLGVYAISASGNYAYLGTEDKFLVIDVSDPSSPQKVGEYNVADRVESIITSGNYAYVSSWNSTEELLILDISNPNTPQRVGSHNAVRNGRGLAISGNYAYLAAGAGGVGNLEIINISNPASPSLVGTYGPMGNLNAVELYGDYVIMPDQNAGLIKIINISNPASPVLSNTYDAGASIPFLDLSGDYLYVAVGGDMRILSISQ